MQGIYGATVASGVGVIVGTNGQLGTTTSSERFKEAIKPMDKASEAILALKPVTFRYKHELDPEHIPQFGLVAEQVEKVNPDLVARDADGKINTVRYEAVNAMLLNEFLKEHHKIEEQQATIAQQRKDFQASISKLEATVAQQQKGMEVLTATVKEQASQIQKVSAQLELGKRAPQMVLNDR
jgi:septal ring factor EnvC (AmiA/AmiB activator)